MLRLGCAKANSLAYAGATWDRHTFRKSFGLNGGDDRARTRDPCRDRAGQRSKDPIQENSMTIEYMTEPLWINEPDWLCAMEFLNDEDPEGRDLAADTIGYLLGHAQLTNTRSLALIGDPEEMAYEILFSFSSPAEKKRFLDLIRSNDDLGSEYVNNDLIQPVKDEIRIAQPLAAVLPQAALM